MARNTKNRPHYSKHKRSRRKAEKKKTESDKNDLTLPPDEPPPISIDKGKLREEAIERARKRPIRERILAFFRRETNKDYKELIINTEALERRVALIENGVLQAFDVERLDEERMVGAIFKGKVQNLEPGLKAAFVDIGQEKNAFLHIQ